MDENLKNIVIENQDRLIYFGANSFAEKIFIKRPDRLTNLKYDELIKAMVEDPSVLKDLSTENLMLMMTEIGEIRECAKSEIIQRLESGENLFGGSVAEKQLMFGLSMKTWNTTFHNLDKKYQDAIINKAKSDIENLKQTDERAYNITGKLNDYLTIENFIGNYNRGYSEEAMAFLESLPKNTLQSINFGIMQDDFLKIDKNLLEHIANYPNISHKLLIVQRHSPKLFDKFVEEINSINGTEHISTVYEEIERLSTSFAQNYHILENEKDPVGMVLKEFEFLEEFMATAPEGVSLDDFLDSKYEETSKLEKNKFSQSLAQEKKKEIFFNKYFSISRAKAQDLVEQYADDFESVSQNSQNGTLLAEIKRILDVNDFEELNNLYKTYSNRHTAKEIIVAESDYRNAYALTYTQVYGETKQRIEQDVEAGNVQYAEYDGQKIPIVKLNGKFNVTVHSSDTGFKGDKELEKDSFKETWEKANSAQHQVATTNIDNNFLGVAPVGKNGVYYAFLPTDPQKLNLMRNEDINSHILNSNYIAGHPKYMSADKMPFYSRRVYSEFDVEKTQPDCVMIFNDMDEQNLQNSYKAASEFGVPIIYIDKREIVKEQIENLHNLVQVYNDKPSVDVIERLIKTFETNKAGWLLNRDNSEPDTTLTKKIQNGEFAQGFDEVGKDMRSVLKDFMQNATPEELRYIKGVLENEESLYKAQNETKVDFAKVKMSDELQISLNEICGLAESKMITSEEVSNEERVLDSIEHTQEKTGQNLDDEN